MAGREARPPQIWRKIPARMGTSEGGLLGSQCPKCGQRSLPPRPICPKCGQNGRTNGVVDHESNKQKA